MRTTKITITLEGEPADVNAWVSQAFASGLVAEYHRDDAELPATNGKRRTPRTMSHAFQPGDRVVCSVSSKPYGMVRGARGVVTTVGVPRKHSVTVRWAGDAEDFQAQASHLRKL